MNEHCTPQPATAGTSPVPSIDLVAGDPPVPRTARTARDTSRRASRMAYWMVAAYSHPDEAVIDLTDGYALTDVAVAGGRVHHEAGFSERGDAHGGHCRGNRYGPVPVERVVTLRAAFDDSLAVAVHGSSRTPGYERPAPPACRPCATVDGQAAAYSRCTARAETLAGAGVGRAHHRLICLLRNDSAGGS